MPAVKEKILAKITVILPGRRDLMAGYLFSAAGWVSMMHTVRVNSDRLRRSPAMTEQLGADTLWYLVAKWW